MAQTHIGAMKILAKRAGVSLDEVLSRQQSKEKWCWKCRTWKPHTEFHADASRHDGLASKCKPCACPRQAPGPSKPERAAARVKGLAWCRGCETWLPTKSVRSGLCKAHTREYARIRYRTDLAYRARRIAHTWARRNIDPIPVEGLEVLLEEFGGMCAYCGSVADTFDHVVPVSNGGRTTPGNIVPACKSCNSSKRDKDVDTWMASRGFVWAETMVNRVALSYCGLFG